MQTIANILLEYGHQGKRGKPDNGLCSCPFFFFSFFMCFSNLPFAKGFGISALSTLKEEPLSGISPLLTQLPERHSPRRVGFFGLGAGSEGPAAAARSQLCQSFWLNSACQPSLEVVRTMYLVRSDCRLAQVICHLARRYITFAASNINIICPPVGIVLFLAMCT